MLQREAAAQLPGNWCTFAQNSVMQIRDIEDAMQVRRPSAAGPPVLHLLALALSTHSLLLLVCIWFQVSAPHRLLRSTLSFAPWQVGQSQWRRQYGGEAAGALRQRCSTTPRSCMPYAAHWARATAI